MADRYWILGTGTWDSTTTTNWSASSGGAGGASVPTASDNVFFDANSNVGTGAFTVTMATTPRLCNDFTASGLDGAMTLAGTSIGLTVSGSLTFQATNFTRTYTGTTTFNATTTGKTVTTNGVAFANTVTFNGVGGGWTLGSAFSSGNDVLVVTNGTFDTGGYSVTAGSISSSNSNIRTIVLNASTVTVNGTPIIFTTSTNFTFNAGTSQINCSSTVPDFAGGGKTFYNVAFTSTAITTASITGANTFNNLSITGRTTVGLAQFAISANQTINGTFTVSAGTASAYRTFILSDTVGTTRTFTCAAVSLTDTDFRDITIAGAASPASGTRLGDCKSNSGITFPAAKTVFYRQTGSANWGATGSGSWSATSGGALDATQFPLAQDTAVFPAATYPASSSTTTINAAYNIGTIDMSLRTSNTMVLSHVITNPIIYGNWINGTGIANAAGNNPITFAGRTTQQITSAGKSFSGNIIINSPSGSVTLQDALTTGTAATTTLTNGTLDLQSYTLTAGLFSSSNSNTRTIAFGTGNITCTGTGTVWTTATVTELTTTGTQVVNVTSVGSTAITVNSGGLSEANSISFNFTGGTYALQFPGSGAGVKNVNFTGYAGAWAQNGSATFYGNLTIASGMSLAPTTGATIVFGATSGTKTFTSNNVSFPTPYQIQFDGVGGTFQLQDDLTVLANTVSLVNGTLDLFGKTLTAGTSFRTSAGTKNLTFNGGTILCSAATTTAFNNSNPTGFTTTAGTGTGTISMTAATAKTFVGGGSTFNCTVNQGGAGALTITGSNTFSNITNTVQPASVLFTAGTTSTFSSFSLSGTAGNLITIGSVTAASHTLSKASGTVSVSFCSISRSTATGGATWNATNSTDGGNNTGWSFGGVIYAAVITETATATDAFLSLAAFLSVLAEAATATDSPSVAESTFNAPVDETATATDSPSVAASTFNAPVDETATATDSVISFADFYAALSETATATDSAVGYMLFPALIAETATATDSVLSFADFYAALAETATATDSPLVAPSTFNAPVSETATATDSDVGFILFPASIAEAATATDSVLSLASFNSALAETATATDSVLSFAAFYAALAEAATATDAVLSLASFSSVLAETATTTDAVLSLASFSSVLAETATTTDSVLSLADFSSALSETVTATDSPGVAASTFNAPVAETATATDSVISFADFYAALSETATATDSAVGYMLFPALIAETATATDAFLSLAAFLSVLAETATATDSPLVAPSTFNAPIAETATATDAVSPPGSIYNAPIVENVTISDLVLGAYLWNLIDDSQSDTWQNVNSSPGTSWSQIDDSQSVTWQNVNSSPGTTWSPIDTDPNTGWTDIPTVN